MTTAQAKRLKELERQNGQLRKIVADLTPDKLILQEAATPNPMVFADHMRMIPLLC